MKLLSRAAREEMDDNHPVFLFDGTVGRRRSWRSDRIHSRRSDCLAKERQVHLLVESAFGFERRHFDTTRRMSSSPRLQMEYVFVVLYFSFFGWISTSFVLIILIFLIGQFATSGSTAVSNSPDVLVTRDPKLGLPFLEEYDVLKWNTCFPFLKSIQSCGFWLADGVLIADWFVIPL